MELGWISLGGKKIGESEQLLLMQCVGKAIDQEPERQIICELCDLNQASTLPVKQIRYLPGLFWDKRNTCDITLFVIKQHFTSVR